MFKINISGSLLPFCFVRDFTIFKQSIPFSFCWQSESFTFAGCFPVAIRFCFEIIHFHRPVPGHGNFFGHQTQVVFISSFAPKKWQCRLFEISPIPAFLCPVGFRFVSAGLYKFQKLTIRYQVFSCTECFNFFNVFSIFVVPAVKRMRKWFSKLHFGTRNGQKLIRRSSSGILTDFTKFPCYNLLQWKLTYKN